MLGLGIYFFAPGSYVRVVVLNFSFDILPQPSRFLILYFDHVGWFIVSGVHYIMKHFNLLSCCNSQLC